MCFIDLSEHGYMLHAFYGQCSTIEIAWLWVYVCVRMINGASLTA